MQRTNTQKTDNRQSERLMSESLTSGHLSFDTETTPMITPSEVIEHLYCPRFTYFMNCLNIPQHEELRYKVQKGRELHQRREESNKDYLRKRLGCVDKEIAVYIASRNIGVRGIVDEVLHLSDGTLAPLDYKYTEYKDFTFETHKVQSVLYALLIMDNYQRPVKRGFICYAKGGSSVKEIIYSESDFCYAKDTVREIFRVILRGYYPRKARQQNKCIDCCYRNICV
ncbi:MAG: CRISPR-associated protein Cas4 [Nitrospirota bacterium]